MIDEDLGKSGASSDREGFQKLVTEVGLGRVGLVMGLEVSRLARNSADWHRLVQICALTGALILDEEGIYDPDSSALAGIGPAVLLRTGPLCDRFLDRNHPVSSDLSWTGPQRHG